MFFELKENQELMCKISVIDPIYNVDKYLQRCIERIINQSFSKFELILVNDGALDSCSIICDDFLESDMRIITINKKNGGLSDARNYGIEWVLKNSESEWITFIDSDDWIHSRYLEKLYQTVNQFDCQISVCGYQKTDGSICEPSEGINSAVLVNSEDFFCNHHINAVIAWGKLYKKEIFKYLKYPVGKLHEDEFTTYKIIFQFDRIAFVDLPLYFYFQNKNSIIRSKWNPGRIALLEAIEESCFFFKSNKLIKAYRYSLHNLAMSSYIYYHNILTDQEAIDRDKYLSQIAEYLKSALIAGFKYGLFPISDYFYFYEIAFPKLIKVYWYGKAAKSKIKGDKRGEN